MILANIEALSHSIQDLRITVQEMSATPARADMATQCDPEPGYLQSVADTVVGWFGWLRGRRYTEIRE